jgi:adenylosuccinate lyase
MIKRYSRPKMADIWSLDTKFQRWLDVEIAACRVQMKLGNIPEEDFNTIVEKAAFDVNRIEEIEKEIQHDVIAFLTNLAENIGAPSRYVHLGLTSSDVVDTAFSILIQDAGKVLLEDLDVFLAVPKKQAHAYKMTPMMGRTHGVHAEPTTLGLKLTVWYAEMRRNRERLVEALGHVNVGKISGAVGNYAHMSPSVETQVCAELGLDPAPISTQILQRDRHAHVITTVAIIGGSLEKMATEIRGLQKTECNEILEPFSSSQKGSSAMPHKKNPILCERVTGLSRVLRGYALTAMENQALWHERDISHSSAERMIFPDATVTLDYMFGLMTKVLDNMQVNESQMLENISRSYDVFYSQQLLLKLVDAGILREDAYRWVQRNAMAAFQERVSFREKILADTQVMEKVSVDDVMSVFKLDKYFRYVDEIFVRVYDAQ